jgi:hypothetical protein
MGEIKENVFGSAPEVPTSDFKFNYTFFDYCIKRKYLRQKLHEG